MDINQVAMICHEANRAYCDSIGDHSQKPWGDAEQWQRDSAMSGVEFAVKNPNAPASSQHDAWLADKKQDGWVCGNVKDPINKTHPCIVPYSDLPPEQRLKDHLFRAIVKAFMAAS